MTVARRTAASLSKSCRKLHARVKRICFDGSAPSHLPEDRSGLSPVQFFHPTPRLRSADSARASIRPAAASIVPPTTGWPPPNTGEHSATPARRLGARSESGKSLDTLRLHAATSRQHNLHLIRRHRYESVERVEAHFNEQVDLDWLRPSGRRTHPAGRTCAGRCVRSFPQRARRGGKA